jgi:predicted nucleic acid-binding Zn ribbon protein
MDRIGREVERSLARSGSRDAIPLASITAVWPDAVGETVARKAWPLRLSRDGTLHVATASSTWAHELALLQDQIRAALSARLGDAAPDGLRFAAGPIPEPGAREATPAAVVTEPPEVPAEIMQDAARAAREIDDPDLRELVSRAARASLLRARSGR